MTDNPGGRVGYDADDYREAIEEHGTIRSAARELGVSRTTVREMCVRHEIEVKSLGGVPEPLPSQTS